MTAAGIALAALAPGFQGARSSQPVAVSSDVCLDCHEDQARGMKGTAHDPAGGKIVACLDCHAGPATAMHVDDPDTYRPVHPDSLSADSLTAVCAACHADPHALNLYERDPHRDAGMSCKACHQVHGNQHAALLKDTQNELCLGCHASARAGFAMPTHHPLGEGVVECRDCHIEVAQSKMQRTAGGPGDTCVRCHGAFQGPFPYEHEPAVSYSVNEGGCQNCHNPHGSTFPMLLKQSYESPHYSLCSQCHSVPKHLNNPNHGTQFAGVPCGDCHVDVHGSYVSRHLLDPSLQAQGCFPGGGGCHDF
jgi:DmsE family decaheme c-type cytochrome